MADKIEHNHLYYGRPETHIALDFHADCPMCRLYSEAPSLLLAAEKYLKSYGEEGATDLQAIIDTIRGTK